jgi:hypothetical protein
MSLSTSDKHLAMPNPTTPTQPLETPGPAPGACTARVPCLLLLLLAAIVTIFAAARPIRSASGYERFPIDAYYYFEMARNLVHNGTMLIKFEQGLPNKFFPGYPLLLSIGSLASWPQFVWPWLNALAAFGIAAATYAAARAWQYPRFVSFASVAFLLSNPVLQKWLAAPVAEPLALLWLLLSVAAVGRARASTSWHWAAIGGVLMGMAAITRPDAIYYALVLAALLLIPGTPARWQKAAWFLVPGALPPIALLVSRYVAAGQVTYLGELQGTSAQNHPVNQFQLQAVRLLRDPYVLHDYTTVNLTLVIAQLLSWVLCIAAAAFMFGRKTALLAWCVLGYLACHAFWYYSSDRFNLLILAPLCLLIISAIVRLLQLLRLKEHTASVVLLVLLLPVTACSALYAPLLITEHQQLLVSDGGRPHRLADVANETPGLVWSEAGPDFAYFFHGPVYIDHDLPYFYHRTVDDEASFFRRHNVTWVVTRHRNPADWFTDHPTISSSTLHLRARIRDGAFTLYAVNH